jgi:deazaflavin-dependent oxidoreductase (nitroreductase family)
MRPVWGVTGLRVLRLANPLVRVVLESRAHRLLSGRLVLLSYRGRRSGREFRIPLRYAETAAGAVVAVAVRPERKQWWRTFAAGERATLTRRGQRMGARGAVVEGDDRAAALHAYLGRYPRSRRVTRDAAVVVFEPGNG